MKIEIRTIEDTRIFDFNLGKFISGSGISKKCDHCGHNHEIHVTLSDNRVVGSTCAKKLSLDRFNQLSTNNLKNAAIEKQLNQCAKGIFNNVNWDSIDKSTKESHIKTKLELESKIESSAYLLSEILTEVEYLQSSYAQKIVEKVYELYYTTE